MAAGRRSRDACGSRPAQSAETPNVAESGEVVDVRELGEQLADVELRADLVLALRLAQQTLAERARTVICQVELVRDGLAHASPQLLDQIQRELRAVKAEGAALARLPR